MPARQGELLPKPARKRMQRMHVSDARHDAIATVEMTCRKCGYESGWTEFDTVTEAKRGLPCPRCNPESD